MSADASVTASMIVGHNVRNRCVIWSTWVCKSKFSYLRWSRSSVTSYNCLVCCSCSLARSSWIFLALCDACCINVNSWDDDQCWRVSAYIVLGSRNCCWMVRLLAMDLLEWDAGEWAWYDRGVNCGVGGIMLGFGTTVIIIGKGGRYGLVLSFCRITPRPIPCGGSGI